MGESLFRVIVAGDEVAAKKPAPDMFDVAVRRLGLRASACIAFEDSANGVLSARRAGLAVVATPSAYTEEDDFAGRFRWFRHSENLASHISTWRVGSGRAVS